jgi:hypothetical protein
MTAHQNPDGIIADQSLVSLRPPEVGLRWQLNSVMV